MMVIMIMMMGAAAMMMCAAPNGDDPDQGEGNQFISDLCDIGEGSPLPLAPFVRLLLLFRLDCC